MARYTGVYGEFRERTGEVSLLVSRAAALERSKDALTRGKEIDALCRGALVLLSSHIEAYIKELGESALDAIYSKQVCRSKISQPFFYYVSRENIDPIKQSDGAESIANSVFRFIRNDVHLWSDTGEFPAPILAEDFNRGFSNPKFDKIKGYFGRFGYKDYRTDFFRNLRASANPIIAALDLVVDTRNAIAHGVASATKTPKEVRGLIAATTIFCRTTDIVFADWFKANICKIR
jgi:hypothetical protein